MCDVNHHHQYCPPEVDDPLEDAFETRSSSRDTSSRISRDTIVTKAGVEEEEEEEEEEDVGEVDAAAAVADDGDSGCDDDDDADAN
jgi:hypothetical protein